MLNTNNSNVRNGRLPLRTFVVFGTILLGAIGSTLLLSKQHYDDRKINDSVFASLDSAINIINVQLLQDNKYQYEEMKSRLNDPSKIEKVNLWKPKLDSAVRMGINIHQFFEKIKQEIFMHTYDTELNEKDFKMLSDSLIQFHKELINILPESRRESLPTLSMHDEQAIISHNYFYKNLGDSGRMAILSKLEFSALQSINIVAHFLNNQIVTENVVYDQFDVLIGQNSTYLLPGQTLEVSAGLGTYSIATKPFITMNGQSIPINENGVAIYRKLVSAKDSSGKIDVSVSFKDPETEYTKTKVMMIGYKVLQPKN